ncbi:ADP-ribosylglycohydrolase family protein [Pelomyxa schiedti]|nr:ADP-ribosylglycohydrolase family protein [Pelomyxa schiedti]
MVEPDELLRSVRLRDLVDRFDHLRATLPPGPNRSMKCDQVASDIEEMFTTTVDKNSTWCVLFHQVLDSLLPAPGSSSSPTCPVDSAAATSVVGSCSVGPPTSSCSSSGASRTPTSGETLVALIFILHSLTGGELLVHSAPRLRRVIEAAQQPPLYVQNVARSCLAGFVCTDRMTYDQWVLMQGLCDIMKRMPPDNDSFKRSTWCKEFLPTITTRVHGPTLGQVIGCLLGQCVGDALGFVVEGANKKCAEKYVADFVSTPKCPPAARGGLPFGQYTDDSQLTRELIISLCENTGAFNPQDYANKIGDMFIPPSYKIVGFGPTTEQAATNIRCGVPWHTAGIVSSTGNGSAMRAAPIGLFFHKNQEALRSASNQQSRITHSSSVCIAAATAISSATRLAIVPGAIDIHYFLRSVAHDVMQADILVAKAVLQLEPILRLTSATALSKIVQLGKDCGDPLWDDGAIISPGAVESMLWSLYSFLTNPTDYVKCMATAILGGGDTDTTAAMAGALSGAHLGYEAIPSTWSSTLTDRGTWGYDQLVALATRAHTIISSL